MRLSSVLAFIFDIDGTLVDSNELHVDSWDRAFRRFGKQFPREQLRAQIGKGSDQYLPEFLTPEEIKRFGKELDEYRSELFRKEYLPKVRPFPKVRELFQRIHDDNKRIVLASSGKKADTEYYVDLLKIGDLIDGCVSGDDADSSKPAPDIFAASLEKLDDISPDDAVTVGDTRFDIEAAGKAGLKTIAFLCGGTLESVLREAGAIAIYRDPADFLAHYDELVEDADRLICSRVIKEKKRPAFQRSAFVCRAKNALINNFNKVRFARADHALRVCKTVHVNRDPAAVHEHEVRIPDQPEMARTVSLDEELFRMPSKTEHLAMTRSELFLVHRRRLICVLTFVSLVLERAPVSVRFTSGA